MDDALIKFTLTAFTTLLVVVDPFGLLPIYLALVRNRPPAVRAGIVTRAVLIGFVVSLFFLLAGLEALSYLGISVPAFSISGGILLFVTAMPMLFGQRASLQAPEEGESGPPDVAIFPLAIPLLAGPGTITTVLLLGSQASGNAAKLAAVGVSLVLVFVITYLLLGFGTERLLRKLSPGGLAVVTRVLGILLAALAVQFVLNGIGDFVRVLGG